MVHTVRRPDGLPDDPITGAIGGAALGAVGGAIAGDPGIGAAVGAGVDLVAGVVGQANQPVSTVVTKPIGSGGRAGHLRAFKTCLAGRGYIVG